jgi:hypothetical protein
VKDQKIRSPLHWSAEAGSGMSPVMAEVTEGALIRMYKPHDNYFYDMLKQRFNLTKKE